MTAGILQLVAQGNEDLYLTLNPQITFFKIVYKRHTNFSIESIQQNFNSKPDFGKKITCTIGKNADLINKIYVVITLPKINCINDDNMPNLNKCAWINNIGWHILKTVEIEIGGYVINKHYGDFLQIWSELILNSNNKKGLDKMIGNVPELIDYTTVKDSYILYVPLYFWFCRSLNNALPITALEFSDIKINIEFASINDLLKLSPTNYIDIDNNIVHFKPGDILFQNNGNKINYIEYVDYENRNDSIHRLYYNKISSDKINNNNIKKLDDIYEVTITNGVETLYINKQINFAWVNNLSIVGAYLLVDYIYLDIEERIKFIKGEHEYIIDVLMYDNEKALSNNINKIKLGYSNPCKEIIFRAQMDYLNNINIKDNYMLDYFKKVNIINNVQIIMNGTPRLSMRSSDYFYLLQNYQNHSNEPYSGVFTYSFALFPEDEQPSGTCNFSKIDDLQMLIQVNKEVNYLNPAKLRVYANCINILKIKNGYSEIIF